MCRKVTDIPMFPKKINLWRELSLSFAHNAGECLSLVALHACVMLELLYGQFTI